MDVPILLMPDGQDRAVAELAAILRDGASASLVATEGAGRAALDRLASELADGQTRIIRVVCPAMGGLSLPALLSQVVGRAKQGVLSDEDLELAADMLTEADPGCRLIVLLVDDAHGLLPPALRYIQFACRTGRLLRVVLAGQPSILDLLQGDEFAFLRQHVSRNIQLLRPAEIGADSPESDEAPAEALLATAAPVAAAPRPARLRGGPAWSLAGLGMAASVALGIWLSRPDKTPTPLAANTAQEVGKPAAPAEPAPGSGPAEAASPTAPEPVSPREAAILQPEPLTVGRAVAAAPPVPEPRATAAASVPEPAMTNAAPVAERPMPPKVGDTAPSGPEPVSAEAAPAVDPPVAVVERPAVPDAASTAVAAGSATAFPERAAGSAPTLPPPAPSAPVMPSGRLPSPAGVGMVAARPPLPSVPMPVPRHAALAVPDAHRRAPKPAHTGPERLAAVDATVDGQRCRDIILRAQLEDITNADRRFLRAGCRTGR